MDSGFHRNDRTWPKALVLVIFLNDSNWTKADGHDAAAERPLYPRKQPLA